MIYLCNIRIAISNANILNSLCHSLHPMNSLILVPITTVNSSTLVTLTTSLAITTTAISSVLGMVTINHAPTISVAAIRS